MTKPSMRHKTITVTGGAGFIGRALIIRLLKLGHHVRCVDIHPFPASCPHVKNFTGNFADEALLNKALSGCDMVIHLASTTIPKTSNENPYNDITSNLNGSLTLLETARKCGVTHFIYASSGGTIYGNPARLPAKEEDPTFPLCSYGIVKLAFERYLAMYAALHNMHTVALRISNPFGPGQNPHGGLGAVVTFCHKAKHNLPIEIWGDGSIIRDYIYIEDVVDAFVKTLEHAGKGDVINIGSAEGLSLLNVIHHIEAQLGRKLAPVFKEKRNFDIPSIILDTSKAQHLLGWKPITPFEDGVQKTLASL